MRLRGVSAASVFKIIKQHVDALSARRTQERNWPQEDKFAHLNTREPSRSIRTGATCRHYLFCTHIAVVGRVMPTQCFDTEAMRRSFQWVTHKQNHHVAAASAEDAPSCGASSQSRLSQSSHACRWQCGKPHGPSKHSPQRLANCSFSTELLGALPFSVSRKREGLSP
jgi:hypothetical protein